MRSIIGVVRVPVVKLLCASSEWRAFYGYPETTRKDWAGITELRGSTPVDVLWGKGMAPTVGGDLIVQTSHCLKLVRNMSFYKFLLDKAVDEARGYSKYGVRHLVLDFSASDEYYEVNEPAVYWLARSISDDFKNACGDDFKVGIRMMNDIWATDIACRFGYDSIFSTESWHWGNMALERNRATDGTDRKKPAIYSDIYTHNFNDKFSGLADACLEGVVVHGEDEDAVDGFGKRRDALANAGAPRISIVGFYSEEIKRGELHSDMTEWGARDYIMLDMEVRENNYKCKSIDERRLQNIVDLIAKLR